MFLVLLSAMNSFDVVLITSSRVNIDPDPIYKYTQHKYRAIPFRNFNS